MTKPVKVIHICKQYDYKPGVHPKKDGDQYPLASWAGLLAKRMKKRYPELDIEVWRPDKEFEKVSHREVMGINTYLFPVRKPMLSQTLSFEMFQQLRKLSQKYELVIYSHSIYESFSIFGPLILPEAKLIAIHHGGLPPQLKNSGIKSQIKDFMIRNTYPKMHKVTYQNWLNKGFLKSFLPQDKSKFWVVGADFNHFKPLDNKSEIRAKLGLDPDTVYGIYVGPYSSIKGVELMLQAYKALRDKYNFSIIFIGGKKSQPLFEEIHHLGLVDFGRVSWYDMNQYYNCADFYLHPIFNFNREAFGVAPVEAMAAGLPVVSTLLPFLQQEYDLDPNLLGKPIYEKKEVIPGIEYMIQNHASYTCVRQNARKILDAETSVIDHLVNLMN